MSNLLTQAAGLAPDIGGKVSVVERFTGGDGKLCIVFYKGYYIVVPFFNSAIFFGGMRRKGECGDENLKKV